MLCMHLSWKTRKIVVSKSKGRILPARACLLITEGRAREGKDPCLSTSTLLVNAVKVVFVVNSQNLEKEIKALAPLMILGLESGSYTTFTS